MLWSQRRNSGAHGAENSIQISALAGVEPRTLASSGRGCCYQITAHPSFSRLLRYAGGYSRTILTPNLQRCIILLYYYCNYTIILLLLYYYIILLYYIIIIIIIIFIIIIIIIII